MLYYETVEIDGVAVFFKCLNWSIMGQIGLMKIRFTYLDQSLNFLSLNQTIDWFCYCNTYFSLGVIVGHVMCKILCIN